MPFLRSTRTSRGTLCRRLNRNAFLKLKPNLLLCTMLSDICDILDLWNQYRLKSKHKDIFFCLIKKICYKYKQFMYIFKHNVC